MRNVLLVSLGEGVMVEVEEWWEAWRGVEVAMIPGNVG
jgi:hypothetical protein